MVTQATEVQVDVRTVVFRGDGEPQSPADQIARLAKMQARHGIEKDTYSLGGVVEQLEGKIAGILGKEAAIFLPTGTLANHLALRNLCGTRSRVIVQEQSHLYRDSGDCVQRLSGINMVPLAKDRPHFDLDEFDEAVSQAVNGRVLMPVGAMMIESPVRRQQGRVVSFELMKALTDRCKQLGIAAHLDGARLFMMSAATGVSPKAYSAMFDTVYVSLYKYFGAPFGGVLAGTAAFIEGMYHDRRMFGGGLASSALAAALALDGIEGFEARFAKAMKKGKDLFDLLDAIDGISVERFQHGSNIFPLRLQTDIDASRLIDALRVRDVQIAMREGSGSQIDLTINTTILRQANDEIADAFRLAVESSR